jgi:pyruvate formate lyase activating enzyme
MSTLHEILYENVREGELYEKLDRNWVRCFACGHCCKIPDGQPGVCKVRYNLGGTLFVPWGYVGGVQCDPVEKKPFFHAHPGALAYLAECSAVIYCAYRRIATSQALRDPAATVGPMRVTPAELVLTARYEQGHRQHLQREPLITSERAMTVFRKRSDRIGYWTVSSGTRSSNCGRGWSFTR